MTEDAQQPEQVVDLEERGWLARHRRGDESAFPALLAAYRRPVYSYLVRNGVAESERDDVFQGIFLKVHRAAGDYDPARPLAPWLFTIVANAVRNHFRDRKPQLASVDADEMPEAADPDPSPERIAQARETVTWLERAIRELPLAQREVLLLVSVAGLRQPEVAESLDLPLNTVKTHLRRARLALAAAMAERDAPSGISGDRHD
ncbi:MAG: RNA polymerase sigma factor [Pseudomonadota bacterium]